MPATRSRKASQLTPETMEPNSADLEESIKTLLMSDQGLMSRICSAVAGLLASKLLEEDSSLQSITKGLSSDEAFMAKIAEEISPTVTDSLDKANKHNADAALKKCTELKTANDKLKKRLDKQDQKLDDMEQYSRRNCLLIHGIPEAGIRGETTDQIATDTIGQHLGISIKKEDLDRTHRIGKPKSKEDEDDEEPKPRPIIVKFTSYATRAQVFRAKRRLKGSGLLITESLTRKKMDLLRHAQNHATVSSSWTIDGTIYCIDTTGKRRTITAHADLEKF